MLQLDRKRKSYLESSGIGVQSGLSSSSSFSSSSSSSSSSSGTKIVFEESSSSSSSRSSSSSSGSSRTGSKETSLTGGRVLTVEERRKLEDAERRKDEEEAKAETGDGSLRHSKRVKEIHFRTQSSGEIGADKDGWKRGETSSGGFETSRSSSRTNSKEIIDGGGVRVENADGRGSKILERGRVEISGAGGYSPQNTGKKEFETKLEEDYYKSYGSTSQGGRQYEGANIEPGIGVGVNRGRYGSNERRYEATQGQGVVVDESFSRRRTEDDNEKRNQGSSSAGRQNFGAVNHTYAREDHTSTNTTWNSEDGGRPITHTATSWRIDEDGIVRNGSTSNVHESDVNMDNDRSRSYGASYDSSRGSNSRGVTQNVRGIASQDTRGGSTTYDTRHSSATDTRGGSATYDIRGGSITHDTRGSSTTQTAGYDRSSNRQENTRQFDGSDKQGSSQYDGITTIAQGRDSVARNYNFDIQGNRDVGRSQQSGSSSFDSLAGVALGPKDGVAKTYTFNVEGNKNEDRHRSSGGENKTWSSGSKHYSSATYDTGRDNVDYDSYEDNDRRRGQASKDERGSVGRDNVDYDNVDRSGYSSSSRWSVGSRTTGDNVRNRDGSYISSHPDGDVTGGHLRTRTYQQSHTEENRLEEPNADVSSLLVLTIHFFKSLNL